MAIDKKIYTYLKSLDSQFYTQLTGNALYYIDADEAPPGYNNDYIFSDFVDAGSFLFSRVSGAFVDLSDTIAFFSAKYWKFINNQFISYDTYSTFHEYNSFCKGNFTIDGTVDILNVCLCDDNNSGSNENKMYIRTDENNYNTIFYKKDISSLIWNPIMFQTDTNVYILGINNTIMELPIDNLSNCDDDSLVQSIETGTAPIEPNIHKDFFTISNYRIYWKYGFDIYSMSVKETGGDPNNNFDIKYHGTIDDTSYYIKQIITHKDKVYILLTSQEYAEKVDIYIAEILSSSIIIRSNIIPKTRATCNIMSDDTYLWFITYDDAIPFIYKMVTV